MHVRDGNPWRWPKTPLVRSPDPARLGIGVVGSPATCCEIAGQPQGWRAMAWRVLGFSWRWNRGEIGRASGVAATGYGMWRRRFLSRWKPTIDLLIGKGRNWNERSYGESKMRGLSPAPRSTAAKAAKGRQHDRAIRNSRPLLTGSRWLPRWPRLAALAGACTSETPPAQAIPFHDGCEPNMPEFGCRSRLTASV
jgi:hypothetical protein